MGRHPCWYPIIRYCNTVLGNSSGNFVTSLCGISGKYFFSDVSHSFLYDAVIACLVGVRTYSRFKWI
jgi:hypothetical protein